MPTPPNSSSWELEHLNYGPWQSEGAGYYKDRHGEWWFADETERLNGPYKTRDACVAALKLYVENL